MFSYPLTLTVSTSDLAHSGFKITARRRQLVLAGAAVGEAVATGGKPYRVVDSSPQSGLVCEIRYYQADDNDSPCFMVSGADGRSLGAVRREARGRWTVLDASGSPIGHVRGKNLWRLSLANQLVTTLADALDAFFFFIFPVRFDAELGGQRVLRLKEKDVGTDAYVLRRVAELPGSDELLLLAGLIVVFWPVLRAGRR